MNLATLDRWWDQLSPAEQAELRATHPPLDKLPKRLLPDSHGHGLNAHLDASIKRFNDLAAAGKPFYLARISDCEVAALGCHYFPHTPHPQGKQVYWMCGYDRNFLPYRKELIQAFKDAHILGVQQNWEPWRINSIAIFMMLGWPVPHPNAVDVHLPYKMLVDGTLFRYLEGKKVLLIGGLAPELARLWRIPVFAENYKQFGRLDRVKSVEAVGLAKRGERGGAYVDIDKATPGILKMDFDVALLSAGVPAKILARRIWTTGRTALDVGFVFDALLGDRERTMRPAMRDIQWPARQGW
jgi:hypothetical protein